VVERFRPPCVVLPSYRPHWMFRPLAPYNRPRRGDSAHFENHWSMVSFFLTNKLEKTFGGTELEDGVK